jgi:hypothetical protein
MLHIDRKPLKKTKSKVDGIPDDLLHRRKAARRALIDARQEKNALELIIKLPEESESVHFVIDGRFEPCDLIPATRRLSDPAIIKELTICTLGFNSDNIACIRQGMDAEKILKTTLICSHYFQKTDRDLYATAFKEIQEDRGGRVYGLRTHAKLILMEMSDGRCFTIEGSGNLRSCMSIEQFVFTCDRQLYKFHLNWLEDYIETTGKK